MKAKGFTLVELVVTVTIVALLASVAMPLAEATVQRNKEQELRRSLREIREAIDAYKLAADEGRIERSADQSGYPERLELLVEGVADRKDPKGGKLYFLRRIPVDPVGGGEWGLRSYASPADAPEEGKDVYDVYSKSMEAGLNGIPYRLW